MEKIIQRAAVADTLNRLMFAVERRDFKLAAHQLADEVTLDYTSLFGGVPQRLSSEAVIEQWSAVFQRLRATQHTLSNQLVDVTKDDAVSTCYVQALHHLPYTDGGSKWMLYGYYEHELVKTTDGWKITSMKLIATHQEGNTSLLRAAANEPIIRSVSFSSEGASLSGLLFLPAGYRGDVKLPAVIVTGSWTTVKEQMPTLYAGLMARKGFAAFVFDFRGFGQSEGEPASTGILSEENRRYQKRNHCYRGIARGRRGSHWRTGHLCQLWVHGLDRSPRHPPKVPGDGSALAS